ncbi:MAG: agmatine deiminase family protein [Bacteroidales bacterium]|nr:agmatine deiminase family protein [Bacteroidales bacterium]MDD4218315.1 agmatine deiminase family protein [Bacteroidales bacterium]MDY0143560.1 agmatine deiminase family protein [Bacteroidales bacterium]
MKKIILSILLISTISVLVAQEVLSPELQSKYHMIYADELKNLNLRNKAFESTPPPAGGVRNIAEFERNQGVIVSYIISTWGGGTYIVGFKIPIDLIANLSQDVLVYVLCPLDFQSNANSDLEAGDVNFSNIVFIDAWTDSEWARDYSPWFIEYSENNCVGIVDFPYNRPQRTKDDSIPIVLGNYFNMDVFGMDLEHTGGNYMTDGMGISASCDLVYEENSGLSETEVFNFTADYLGADEYLLVPDPLDDYIEHIDCWGKFLDVDKMLVASVPADDYRYADYEAMADYWANQTSSYGNKFKVYRTAWMVDKNAYTNSLIMNNKVFVPFNTGSQGAYNDAAAIVYEEAMPGYEIIGVSYNNWYSTDALHCRTHEVPDFEMLRISHYPTLDTVDFQTTYEFTAEIYTFNHVETINSVKFYYSVNGAVYQQTDMINTSGNTYSVSIDSFNPNETISYYIEATNSAPKTETHPFIGLPDPHLFYIKNSNQIAIVSENAYVKAFPNPANNELYLITNNLQPDNYSCEIFDQQGKLVLTISNDFYSSEWDLRQIDISNLKSGLYFVRASSEKQLITTKFIKL